MDFLSWEIFSYFGAPRVYLSLAAVLHLSVAGSLFQNREHERAVWATGQQHTLSVTHVHMETLENTKEQNKELDKIGCATLGSIQDNILRSEDCKEVSQRLRK